MTNGPLGLLVLSLAHGASAVAADELPPAGVRIRITGKEAVELPGVASIAPHSERVYGRVVSWDHDLVAVETGSGEAPLALPHPGRRFTGELVSADESTLSLRLDEGRRLVRIPREAIARLEVSRERRTRSSRILQGAGKGLLISGAVYAPYLLAREQDCSGCAYLRGVGAFGVVLGTVVGGLVGANASLDRWERVPPSPPKVQLDLTSPRGGGLGLGLRVSF